MSFQRGLIYTVFALALLKLLFNIFFPIRFSLAHTDNEFEYQPNYSNTLGTSVKTKDGKYFYYRESTGKPYFEDSRHLLCDGCYFGYLDHTDVLCIADTRTEKVLRRIVSCNKEDFPGPSTVSWTICSNILFLNICSYNKRDVPSDPEEKQSFFALQLPTLHILWSHHLKGTSAYVAKGIPRPIVNKQRSIFVHRDGKIFSLHPSTGAQQWVKAIGNKPVPISRLSDGSLQSREAQSSWFSNSTGYKRIICSDLKSSGEFITFLSRHEMPTRLNFRNRHYLRFHCMELETGKEVFTFDFWTTWSDEGGKGFIKHLVTQDEHAVLISSKPMGRSNDFSGKMLINYINLADGKIVWRKEIDGISRGFTAKWAALIDAVGFLNILSTDRALRLSLENGLEHPTKMRVICPDHYVSLLPYLKLQVLYPHSFGNLSPDGIYDNCYFEAVCSKSSTILCRSKVNGAIRAYDPVTERLKWNLDEQSAMAQPILLQDKDVFSN